MEDLGPGGRTVAACLAAVWTGAGLAGLALGLVVRPVILPVMLGALAIAYGGIWVRVAVTGRRVRWGTRRQQ
jgi:ABC-type transport system involved in cytochrome c biogenesis permease component